MYDAETLIADVPMLKGGPTPYVAMGKLGRSLIPQDAPRLIRDTVAAAFSDWIGVLFLVLTLVFILRARRSGPVSSTA